MAICHCCYEEEGLKEYDGLCEGCYDASLDQYQEISLEDIIEGME